MLTGTLNNETKDTIEIKLTTNSNTEYMLVVAKVGDFTTDELVQRWSRKAKMEYMRNRITFTKFVDRINARHEKIVAGEIEPILPKSE